MTESTEVMRVAGLEVEVPAPPARALHLALHAFQHGTTTTQALGDLARALEVLDGRTWAAAAALAERLEATGAFASGLRLHPEGRRVAAELALPARAPARVALLAGDPPPGGGLAFEQLASTPGVRAKLVFVARKLLPTRRFMRWRYPRAARGGRWMALAYLWRPIWLLLRAGPALIAWLRARSRSRSR